MSIKIILLNNDTSQSKEYSLNPSTRIIDLKETIVKDLYKGKGYVDIDFLLERTKRTFGKLNLEAGIISRSLDVRTLNDFGLKNDIINIRVNYTNENIQTCGHIRTYLSNESRGTYVTRKPIKPIKPFKRSKISKTREKKVSDNFSVNIDEFPILK